MCSRLFTLLLPAACAFMLCPAAFSATWCVNPHRHSVCKSTITAAVAAASPGDTIHVARGIYKEDVVILKPLSLIGEGRYTTIIDATGKPNGIFINGIGASPNAGVTDVTISGFTVENANFEGILAASADGLTIVDNFITNNDLSLSSNTCPGIPDFETNEGMDCGEGLHLMGGSSFGRSEKHCRTKFRRHPDQRRNRSQSRQSHHRQRRCMERLRLRNYNGFACCRGSCSSGERHELWRI